MGVPTLVNSRIRRLNGLLIALIALAFSASLAFGASPPEAASWGLSNAASHAGMTVPVAAGGDEESGDEVTGDEETGDEETGDEETGDEETGDEEGTEPEEAGEDAGENCATDPTGLTPEDVALMNHGSVVCWAAQQTEWPEWFANHGAFVRCWAHQGKADAASCTEAPTDEATSETDLQAHGKSQGKGHGKGHTKQD